MNTQITVDGEPNWEGRDERECGDHRTVGPHRAWCFDDHEWCYPDVPCRGCEIILLRDRIKILESQPFNSRISSNEDGTLDEIWARGSIHLEQMSSDHWWMAIYLPDGRTITVNFWTPRSAIRTHWSLDSPEAFLEEAGESSTGIRPPTTPMVQL